MPSPTSGDGHLQPLGAPKAGAIFFSERLWKTNKVGAIVMMVAMNGATAAVSMRNMQNGRSRQSSVCGDLLDGFQDVVGLRQDDFFQLRRVGHRRVHGANPCDGRIQILE